MVSLEQLKALGAESWAVRELMDLTLGNPVEADLIERLERLEEAAEADGAAGVRGA